MLPITPEDYPETVPTFASEAEARDFWDTHDSTFYWDQMEDVADVRDAEPVPVEERTPRANWLPTRADTEFLRSLGFQEEAITQIRNAAVRRRVPLQSMLNEWVGDRLTIELDRIETDSANQKLAS